MGKNVRAFLFALALITSLMSKGNIGYGDKIPEWGYEKLGLGISFVANFASVFWVLDG